MTEIKLQKVLIPFYLVSHRLELAPYKSFLSSVGAFVQGRPYRDKLVCQLKAAPWKKDADIGSAARLVLTLVKLTKHLDQIQNSHKFLPSPLNK